MSLPSQLHPKAALGFQHASEAYEKGRPEYPKAAVDWIATAAHLQPHSKIIDLAAGTGKFTRLLIAKGFTVTAIEPVEAMRHTFKQTLPGITVVEGTAESIPLEANSIDAVMVAQAFHWFQGERAVSEIARILKPGGTLNLIWNIQDKKVAWVQALNNLINPYSQGVPRYETQEWQKVFLHTPFFSSLQKASFSYGYPTSFENILNRLGSISFIAALPPKEYEKVRAQADKLLKAHFLVKNAPGEILFPYQTDVFSCTKLDSFSA